MDVGSSSRTENAATADDEDLEQQQLRLSFHSAQETLNASDSDEDAHQSEEVTESSIEMSEESYELQEEDGMSEDADESSFYDGLHEEIDEEEDEEYDEDEQQEEEFSQQQPLHQFHLHSYLPGISHSLCPPELVEQRKRQQALYTDLETTTAGPTLSSSTQDIYHNNRIELPVLQLSPGIVIFPGSTLPLRLRNPDWVRYLQRQIDRVTQWNPPQPSSAATSLRTSSATTETTSNTGNDISYKYAFDYSRDVVAIGILPIKEDYFLNDNNEGNEEEDAEINVTDREESRIGRIGTLALLTYLSREEDGERNQREDNIDNHLQQQQPQRPQQIVATALGM